MTRNHTCIGCVVGAALLAVVVAQTAESDVPTKTARGNPFARQVEQQLTRLQADESNLRAAAAEALGYLRDYEAGDALLNALSDDDADVRREAALALAWCGARPQVSALLKAMDDADWSVRQAASVARNNLTGMEFPFDALADPAARSEQAARWRTWWKGIANNEPPAEVMALVKDENREHQLRGIRALGALGGKGAAQAVVARFQKIRAAEYDRLDALDKQLGQACLRALGRLREPASLPRLIELLEDPGWARYAADALGDYGSRDAVVPLIAVYPRFSRDLDNPQKRPELCPRDDRFAGDNTQDRMFETPYEIARALVRLPLNGEEHRLALRDITPYLLANLPSDWDGGMLYEPEAFEEITAYLVERAGLRDVACQQALASAAAPDKWFTRSRDRVARPGATPEQQIEQLARKLFGDVPYLASWLPAFCDARHVPQLIELLDHENGWIRINATKALMFIGDRQAIEPIAVRLARSHPDAEYGFSGGGKIDIAPRTASESH